MKVGDYVRTKYGIAKVISTKVKDEDDNNVLQVDKMLEPYFCDGCDRFLCDPKDIIKSNSNIKKLIEKGDYVNGFRVECDDLLGEHIVIFESEERKYKRLYLNKIYIKSIVTHEQFERMQYNLESEVN